MITKEYCKSACIVTYIKFTHSALLTASFYGATRPLHSSTPSLHVCLTFTATHGTVLTALSNQGPSLALTLTNHTLTAHLPSSPQQPVVDLFSLNITTSSSSWLQLELTIANDNNLSLVLQNAITAEAFLPPSFNFTGVFHLGGDPFANTTSNNFVGCISNVSLNSQSVDFSESAIAGYHLGCCIPPRRSPSRGLGVVNESLWGAISIGAYEVMVDQGSTAIVSDVNFPLSIPSDLVSYNVGYWYRDDLTTSIVIDIVNQPSNGHFTRGSSANEISSFYYHDLQSTNPSSQVRISVFMTSVIIVLLLELFFHCCCLLPPLDYLSPRWQDGNC